MSEVYVGEIRCFPYTFAPRGWAVCDGSLQSIQRYTALYAVIGATYGGNGTTTFALPDLRGRVMLHAGEGTGLTRRALGETGGVETVALAALQMPAHAHVPRAGAAMANATAPTGNLPAALPTTEAMYVTDRATATAVPMRRGMLDASGTGAGHENCAPTLTLMICIALEGIFPSRS